jgi:hypothetical protein
VGVEGAVSFFAADTDEDRFVVGVAMITKERGIGCYFFLGVVKTHR